ncbi:MAG: hypothetical protein FJ291_30510 [Planctomycetes bacterium]|nr:hypothetical protein [Planctomycetota bacterium]
MVFAAAVLLVAIGSVEGTQAAERTFTLRDHINHAWSDELVHYQVSFGPGECWTGGARLADHTGRLVPLQFSEVELHPDGSVAEASVWFQASVPPNASVTYTLTGGKKRDKAVPHKSDLSLVKEKDSAVLATTQVGVRVLLGERRFATPQSAERVPAPLQGVRLRTGARTGRGWIETKHQCTGYSAVIAGDGAVFKRVVIRYSFLRPEGWGRAEAPYYQMAVRVAAGQEIAYITEDYNLGDPKVYQPPQYADKMDEALWNWWGGRPHETPNNVGFSFHSQAFAPTHARTIGPGVSSPDKGKCASGGYAENEYPLKYDKDRFEFTVAAWVGWQVDQSQVYTMYSPEKPDSDIIALFGCHAGNWRNPDMLPHEPAFIKQHTDTTPLRIYTSAKPDLFVRGPLNLGRREWALAVLKNPGVVTEKTNLTPIAALTRKHGFLPLDKVKDWVLDWPQAARYPRLFTDAGDMESVRARIKVLPRLQADIRNTGTAWGRWLLDGKDEDLQGAYKGLMDRLDIELGDALGWPNGAGERTSINGYPWGMQEKSALADTLLGSDRLTVEQKSALRSRMAFMAYLLRDPNFLPPRKAGYGWGSANMPVNVGGARAITACLLSDHPKSREWLADSIEYFDERPIARIPRLDTRNGSAYDPLGRRNECGLGQRASDQG